MEKQSLKQKLFEIQNKHLKYEKDAVNPFFKSKYLSLDSLWATLAPELEKLNLLVVHGTREKEVVTRVIDMDSEDTFFSSIPLPDDLNPQKLGSAITYHKRYNLGQIFNIMTDEDDDAQSTVPKKKSTDATVSNKEEDILDF